jgi:lysophospholipase L1-like esterase
MVTTTLRAMSHARMLAVVVVALVLLVPDAASAAARNVYVSLGDSYATGYQATGKNKGQNTRNGFAYQLPALARPRGYALQLVNFACGGATTASMLRQRKPCALRGRGPGGRSWGGATQVTAAERYLRANRRRVALVTVSIGGNDVTPCARKKDGDQVLCVIDNSIRLEENLREITRRLRAAAGPSVRIVGITYPDVLLGLWVGPGRDEATARLSIPAFKALINPALKAAYESVRGRFVDVTAATGAYGVLEKTTTLEPYGTIPVPVARVCRLTSYCRYRDIHATTEGYRLIARLVAATLPRRR